MALKILRTIYWQRPEHIPDDWEIYAAPRPLWGNEEWTDNTPLAGRLFVAVDPDAWRYEDYMEHNQAMDATRIYEITRIQALAEIILYYEREYPDMLEEFPIDEYEEDYIRSWFTQGYDKRMPDMEEEFNPVTIMEILEHGDCTRRSVRVRRYFAGGRFSTEVMSRAGEWTIARSHQRCEDALGYAVTMATPLKVE